MARRRRRARGHDAHERLTFIARRQRPAGIVGDGMTYHIKVRFRVDPSGLVTSAQITEGSGNSELDTAVLSAARRMSFACNAEAHGVKSYRVS